MTAPRPSLKAAIIALLEAGLSDAAIVARTGCSASYPSLIRHMTRGFAPLRATRKTVAAIDWATVATLARLGLSQAAIGKRFGVGQTVICDGMHARGIRPGNRNGRKRAGEISPAGLSDLGPLKHSSPTTETELSSLHSEQLSA